MEGATNIWTARAEELAGKLARYPGPTFRKAYLANLMASGSRLSAAGDMRAGAYCFDKVAQELMNVGETQAVSSALAPTSSESETSHGTPLESLRHQWRKDRLEDAQAVLHQQSGRLSDLENRIYHEKLDRLRSAGEKATTRAQSSKVDSSILDLRRQLYKRVLKSQKVSLRRKQMPVSALKGSAAFSLLPVAPGSKANPASSLALPERDESTEAPVVETLVGPYNDRYNLGDLLALMAQADAAWVEEFLDLYRGLRDLKGMTTSLG